MTSLSYVKGDTAYKYASENGGWFLYQVLGCFSRDDFEEHIQVDSVKSNGQAIYRVSQLTVSRLCQSIEDLNMSNDFLMNYIRKYLAFEIQGIKILQQKCKFLDISETALCNYSKFDIQLGLKIPRNIKPTVTNSVNQWWRYSKVVASC